MNVPDHLELSLIGVDYAAFGLAALSGIVRWIVRRERDLPDWGYPIIWIFTGVGGWFLFRFARDELGYSILTSLAASFGGGLIVLDIAVGVINRLGDAIVDRVINKISGAKKGEKQSNQSQTKQSERDP